MRPLSCQQHGWNEQEQPPSDAHHQAVLPEDGIAVGEALWTHLKTSMINPARESGQGSNQAKRECFAAYNADIESEQLENRQYNLRPLESEPADNGYALPKGEGKQAGGRVTRFWTWTSTWVWT